MINKILERFREVGNIQFQSYTKPIITVEDAMRIVQEVAKDGGWIPCEVEMPKENGLEHYEITFLSGINKTPIRSVAIFSKGRWYMPGTYCRDCDWFPFEVIAWKKPSAPYQKGE